MTFLNGLELNGLALLVGVLVFLVGFTLSMAVLVLMLVKLPATYFQGPHSPKFWAERHPVLRWTGLIAKNLLGILLIMLGFFLSVPGIPGQGLLTILIGIMLLNFPGKRRLERRLVNRPKVFRAINWLRARFGKPPLVLDSEPALNIVEPAELDRGPSQHEAAAEVGPLSLLGGHPSAAREMP